MKSYVKNILLYLVALLGIISFILFFGNPLRIYNSLRDSWTAYNVKAYAGEIVNGVSVYRGTIVPIFGFVIPLVLSIVIIVESFKPSWLNKMKIMNTVFGILFLISAVLVLLTKDLFLAINNMNISPLLKNGVGPIFSACCSCVAGILLLVVTYIPFKNEVKFIEK